MEQIETGIYIEDSYIGVTLGALALSHGSILIDAPPCPEDTRSWRAALRNLGSGVNRLLINLDDHLDRTLGARAMECPVMAHIETANSFRNQSAVFKGHAPESGADWEQCVGLSGIRWAPPSLTYSDQAVLYWDENPLILEHHPGPTPGATWIVLPEANVVFVGDAVLHNQPPYLAKADLNAWIEALDLLVSPRFKNYLIISSRGGPVPIETVREQRRSLKYILKRLTALGEREAHPDTTETLIPKLLSDLEFSPDRQDQFHQRLAYGLYHYYARYFWPNDLLDDEE
jgi:glyoxylase-like metal-dependent hydrolase (beta-lactamase superfamily II)